LAPRMLLQVRARRNTQLVQPRPHVLHRMAIHADPRGKVVEEDPLRTLQLLRLEREHVRRRERQHVARHPQRLPRRLPTSRLERLERARPRKMDRVRSRELRTPHDIRNARERTVFMSALESLASLVAETADMAPADSEEGSRGRGNLIHRRGAEDAEVRWGRIRFFNLDRYGLRCS